MNEIALGKCFSWGAIVLCDERLTPATKLTCLIIEKFSSPLGTMKWPGKKALCELSGLTMERLDKALKQARDLKYLKYLNFMDEPIYAPCFPDGHFQIPDQWNDKRDDSAGTVTVKVPEEKTKELLALLYGEEYAQAVVDIFLVGRGECDGKHGERDGAEEPRTQDPSGQDA